MRLLTVLGHVANDVRVSRVRDGQATDAEVLAAGGAKVDVVAGVVVDAGLSEHGVVLNLGLLERGAVVGNDDEPSLALTKCLQRLLVAELSLAGLHDQGQARVDALGRLLGLLRAGRHVLGSSQRGW